MKNKSNPGGAPLGPKVGWAEWRAKKDRSLAKPRRSAAAQKINTPKQENDSDTSSEVSR